MTLAFWRAGGDSRSDAIVALERGCAAKRSKFTAEQVAFAVRQAEGGTSVDEVRRKIGISDALFDSRRRHALIVVDMHMRECPAIEVRPTLKGEDVIRNLQRVAIP